jgi:hypothetical protein
MPRHSMPSVRLYSLLLAAVLMLLPARSALADVAADSARETVTAAQAPCCDPGLVEPCVSPEEAMAAEACPQYCMQPAAADRSTAGLPGPASLECPGALHASRTAFPSRTLRISAASPPHRTVSLIHLFQRLLN